MWSIGIYEGDSLFSLHPSAGIDNPVLTCHDISDAPASFVADPFMIRDGNGWNMFFEVLNRETRKGEIGLATSKDNLCWTYRQIVLREPYHLSYPQVFKWRGEFYMIPETLLSNGVRLYKATSFPAEWSFVATLIEGSLADPSIFYFDGRWWMFACSTPYQHDTLRLYFADDFFGPWSEHPASPLIVGNKRAARPGGRVLVIDDRVIRFAQDCYPRYGSQVRAFEISELTATSYYEQESSESLILKATGSGWNGSGMHHIDAHLTPGGQWVACVDGSELAND